MTALRWSVLPVVAVLLAVRPAAAETESELVAKITAGTKAFAESVGADAMKKNTYAFGGPEHRYWHWIPTPQKDKYGPRGRAGVCVEDLNEKQIGLLHDLLRVSLSGEGYRKVQLVIRQEGPAAPREAFVGLNRNPGWYFFTFFGEIGAKNWGWRFEGHHVSLTYEFVDGKIKFSPSMIGFNPSPLPPSSAELAMNLYNELTPEMQKAVQLAPDGKGIPADCTRDADTPKLVGAKLSGITDDAKWYLIQLLEQYIANYPEPLVKPLRKQLHKELGDAHFAWWGPMDHAKEHFYRLQAPSFLIEMRHQGGGINKAHIHGVYRSLIDGSVNSTVASK